MPAATKDRNTQEVRGFTRAFGMLTNVVAYAGTLACLTAAGLLTKGATSTTLRCVGVFRQSYNSTGIADGGVVAEADVGVFGPFLNSAAGDQITVADVGTTCFMVDDQTLAKTNGSNTRSAAGTVWSVDAEGVYIRIA